jgi:predicted MFS family arabinose efflux permease
VVVATEFIAIGLLPAMSRGLEISLGEAGHFVSVFALGSAVLGPLLTMPAVRWQPRIVMVAALVPFALGNLAAAVLPGYGVVLATRLLQGAAWRAAHAAAFLSSQIRVMQSAPSAPAFAAALNISAANIGIAAGAAAGGAIIEQASLTTTGIGGAALAVVAVVLASALRGMGVR